MFTGIKKVKSDKGLFHVLTRLQTQKRYICLNIMSLVEAGDFLEAQRFTRFFKIIDRKCKLYAELKHID